MESGINESRRDFLSDKFSTSLEGGELGPKLTMRDFFQITFAIRSLYYIYYYPGEMRWHLCVRIRGWA